MRPASLACFLAITLGCGGKASPGRGDDHDGREDRPFTAKAGFKPTAFTADVRGKGHPVIFIPGLGCPGEIWDDAVKRIDAEVDGGIEAHVLTLAGFAGTEPIRPPLAAKTRKELVQYIRSRELERPIVIGHSMGGFIAYWLATTSSGAIGGFVVVDAGPALADGSENDARRLRNVWAQAGDDEVRIRVRTVYSWMVRDKRTIEPYFDAIAKSDRQTIGDSIYELATTDVRDKLDSITAPGLIVLADGGYQRRYREMAADIPDHEVVVLPKTKHFVMFDDPAGFSRVVSRFVTAHAE